MSYINAQYVFFSVIFLAVVLAIEGAFIYWRDVRAPKQRMSKRMQMLASGASTEEILATLRRATSESSSNFLPGLIRYLEVRMSQAGMRMPAATMMMLMLGTTVSIGIVFPLIGGIMGAIKSFAAFLLIVIFAMSLGVALPLIVLNMKATKRLKLFEEQFPIALDIFVRGLRAGYPVTSALELLVEEVRDPIASEFGLVVAEMQYGYSLRDSLANLANRIQTQDINMFVVSVAIQAETGGSLADILDGLSKVIRDRASMTLKVRALASEGKMTGILLSVLPAATFVFTFATQPQFYLSVVDDSWFLPGVGGVLTMYVTGVLIMNRMIKIKV